MTFTRVRTFLGLVVLWAAPVLAQQPQQAAPAAPAGSVLGTELPGAEFTTRICGEDVPAPSSLPPAGSGPVIYFIAPCFEEQGGASVIDPETYLYYIQLKPSLPSQNKWIPWDAEAEKTVHE